VARAKANGIEIEYETAGDKGDPALLLIMGLGAQLTIWPDALCQGLAAKGFFVVRYDNRDVGLSTDFGSWGVPNIAEAIGKVMQGRKVDAPYLVKDMAADGTGLLDALGLDRAHMVGASMGGMIAQSLALEHPERVRSLVSIMSSTGNPELPPAKPEAMARLMLPAPPERASYIEHMLASQSVMSGSGFPFDVEAGRRLAGRLFDRAFYPAGAARQIAAVLSSGSRKDALTRLRVPTLVIHGMLDPLVQPSGGIATARAIPGAKLVMYNDMAHDLPPTRWSEIADEIAAIVARAPQPVGAAS
jgi:pimeloyl-ACP methyl ester carboxylesterase